MCKVFCTEAATRITTDCVQMCGGIGYMRDFPVEKFMRDAKVAQILEGTNQAERDEVARLVIDETAFQAKEPAAA